MILVIGGASFVRNVFVSQLERECVSFRLLIQPSKKKTILPTKQGVQVVVASLSDERGVRAAMQDVEVVYHLSGLEESGVHLNLDQTDIDGLRIITNAASQAGIQRFFYLSSIGADRASGFYFLKAKGIAESIIQNMNFNYTIFRTSQIFGSGDRFIAAMASCMTKFPFISPIPADLSVIMQPLWVSDLAASLVWALNMPETKNQTLEIGGPEQISLESMLRTIADNLHIKPRMVPYNPNKYTFITLFLEKMIRDFPDLVYWTDFIAPSRICPMDSLPRLIGINPARFHTKLDFLSNKLKKRSD